MKISEVLSQDIIDSVVGGQKGTKSQRVLDLRENKSKIDRIIMGDCVYIKQSEVDFLSEQYYSSKNIKNPG